MTRPTPCPNLNHRRSDAPVRFCPQCGGTVNAGQPIRACTNDSHAAARRQQTTYCAHCGVRLITSQEWSRQATDTRVSDREDAW